MCSPLSIWACQSFWTPNGESTRGHSTKRAHHSIHLLSLRSTSLEMMAEMALDIQQYQQNLDPGKALTDAMVDRYIKPATYGEFILDDGSKISR